MEKRGQVTIFIVVAIIIIGAVGLYFSLRGGLKQQVLSPETEGVYLFVQSCIEETGEDAVHNIGQNGGYFLAPEFSTSGGIPYYYSEGKNYMPSKERVGAEVSRYVNEMLFFCTRNFIDFPDFDISQEGVKTETRIGDNKIILNVEYPLRIIKGESTSIIREFNNIEIPVRLGIVYDSIGSIIQNQLTHEDICLSCILDIALENDLYVDMLDYDEETLIFVIRDKTSKINEKDFEFIFANRYQIE